MALADALAPEGVGLSLRENGPGVDPVQGKQAGVPAGGDDRRFSGGPGGGVHIGEVLRDAGVGVKAVHHVEQGGQPGGLLRQVGGAAAAEDHHIDGVNQFFRLIHGVNGYVWGADLDTLGSAAGQDGGQLHIRVLTGGGLHAFS